MPKTCLCQVGRTKRITAAIRLYGSFLQSSVRNDHPLRVKGEEHNTGSAVKTSLGRELHPLLDKQCWVPVPQCCGFSFFRSKMRNAVPRSIDTR